MKVCIIIVVGQKAVATIGYTPNGGAPGSIAGERKNKHTVDGVATIKHST